MSSKGMKRLRKVVKNEKKVIVTSVMRDIYHLPFKERLKIVWRIIARK